MDFTWPVGLISPFSLRDATNAFPSVALVPHSKKITLYIAMKGLEILLRTSNLRYKNANFRTKFENRNSNASLLKMTLPISSKCPMSLEARTVGLSEGEMVP